MGRRASREIAMKLLYQLEIQRDDIEEQIEDAICINEIKGKDKDYVLDVVSGVHDKIPYLDKLIDKYSKGWKIGRMSKVDLSILRLCIYEISFRDDIPLSVSVNEAVELGKKYSGEEAGAFINGILGKISKVRVLPTDHDNVTYDLADDEKDKD